MKRALHIPLFILLAGLLTVSTEAKKKQYDVTGAYSSNWGEVYLAQKGKKVEGYYKCCGGGQIKGQIKGNVIKYDWKQPGGYGKGIWKVSGDGHLLGTWGNGNSRANGGAWDLKLVKLGRDKAKEDRL